MTHDDDERRQIESLRTEVLREYGQLLGEQSVTERFNTIVADFDDARVRTFVPLLAQRRVHQELRGTVSS
jgi:hypothetical protein